MGHAPNRQNPRPQTSLRCVDPAYLLATWSGARVALVDLDLQFGEVTTALRLRVQHSIADALGPGEPQSQTELASHLSGLLTPHDTGIQVLAAPRHPVEADRVTPAEVSRVINALRTTCDYVIVDTPTGLAETVLAALDASEHLFVLAALDLPSVRNLRLFVQTLERLRIPSEGISLILNKAQSGLGIEAGEVARVFNRDFRSILPFAVEVQRSMNVGVPVLSTDPGAEISRGLVHCLADLLPDAARQRCLAAVPEPPRRRGLARFFDMIRGQRPDPSAVGPTVPVPLHPGADV